MEYRKLGTTGIEASVIAFGAWAIGGWKWGGTDDQDSIRALHAAHDHGINFIDTAPVYGMGHSESVVGQAIRDRRSDFIIATKCGLRWEGLPEGRGVYFFTDDEGRDIFRCLHPESIRQEVEASLQRLGIETIDLYQTHWQDKTVPIEDTMEMLLRLKQEGKIRAIGVCNANLDQLKQYQAVGPLDTDQECFSMLDQGLRGHNLTYIQEQKMGFLAYSSLALGLLTGKVTPDREFPDDDLRSQSPRFSRENRQKVLDFLHQLQPLADQYAISLAQFVLAWSSRVPGVSHLLTGIRNPQQARENARAGAVDLKQDDFRKADNLLRKADLDLPAGLARKRKGGS